MIRCVVVVVAFLLAGNVRVFAAPGDPGSAGAEGVPVFKESDPYAEPERKEPSFWHSPARDTPAAQLALAASVEKQGRISRAIRANRSLVHRWHEAQEAALAQQNLARLLESAGRYEDAFLEYQYLIAYFPGRFPFLDALDHQYRIANILRAQRPTFLGLHLDSLEGVRKMYERLLINGPRWEKAPEVALLIGLVRESEDEIPEALAAYEQVQNLYPGTDAARDASYRSAICRFTFARKHPRDAQSRAQALAALNAFARDYTSDPRRAEVVVNRDELARQDVEAAYAQAVFYDRSRNDRAAAILAYRDFLRRYPDASVCETVRARLAQLEKPTVTTTPGVRTP
jgi:tetratricopeptide (TPR) repeat protein